MRPGPRRNFRNMGFHFLTLIFNFLSKPEPNEKLVSYSMKTRTWTRKTTSSKNPKIFLRQITISQLSLSKLSFDKKILTKFFGVAIFKQTPKTWDKGCSETNNKLNHNKRIHKIGGWAIRISVFIFHSTIYKWEFHLLSLESEILKKTTILRNLLLLVLFHTFPAYL